MNYMFKIPRFWRTKANYKNWHSNTIIFLFSQKSDDLYEYFEKHHADQLMDKFRSIFFINIQGSIQSHILIFITSSCCQQNFISDIFSVLLTFQISIVHITECTSTLQLSQGFSDLLDFTPATAFFLVLKKNEHILNYFSNPRGLTWWKLNILC